MAGKDYRDLIAWQKAMDFVEQIYKVTRAFPKEELYGLTNQLRRCSVSIASNVAEGQGRRTKAEFAHRLSLAHGSVCEAETQLMISGRLGYLKSADLEAALSAAGEVGRLVIGLRNSISRVGMSVEP